MQTRDFPTPMPGASWQGAYHTLGLRPQLLTSSDSSYFAAGMDNMSCLMLAKLDCWAGIAISPLANGVEF